MYSNEVITNLELYTSFPQQTCSFRQQLDFYGKHSAVLLLLYKNNPLTFPLLYIARYSCIQMSELRRRGENENAGCLEMVAKVIRAGLPRLRVRHCTAF